MGSLHKLKIISLSIGSLLEFIHDSNPVGCVDFKWHFRVWGGVLVTSSYLLYPSLQSIPPDTLQMFKQSERLLVKLNLYDRMICSSEFDLMDSLFSTAIMQTQSYPSRHFFRCSANFPSTDCTNIHFWHFMSIALQTGIQIKRPYHYEIFEYMRVVNG